MTVSSPIAPRSTCITVFHNFLRKNDFENVWGEKKKNWWSTAKGINHIWITLIFLSELSEQPLKLEYESITTGWYEIIMVIKTNNYGLFWVDISSLITRLTTSNSLNHNADGFISAGYGWYSQSQLIWFVISCSSRVVASRSHSSLLLN